MAGRKHLLSQWESALDGMDTPPRTTLMLVNDSEDRNFGAMLYDSCSRMRGKFEETIILRHLPQLPKNADFFQRHQHVASIYNHALGRIQSDYVFTLEDDMTTPPDAMWKLFQELTIYTEGNPIVAVGGVYRSRESGDLAVASSSVDEWTPISLSNIPDSGIMDVGMIGWGSTVWNNRFLRLTRPTISKGLLGADAVTCQRLRNAGGQIKIHGEVRCTHYV